MQSSCCCCQRHRSIVGFAHCSRGGDSSAYICLCLHYAAAAAASNALRTWMSCSLSLVRARLRSIAWFTFFSCCFSWMHFSHRSLITLYKTIHGSVVLGSLLYSIVMVMIMASNGFITWPLNGGAKQQHFHSWRGVWDVWQKKIGSLGDQNRRRDLFMAPKPSPALSRAPTVLFYIWMNWDWW